MIDRTGEVYEWKETGEIFVILGLAYVDNIGDKKWNAAILVTSPDMMYTSYERIVGQISTFSEMWFSDSTYSWKMRRLSGDPPERRESR
jgi:hypothetical protein